MGAVFIVGLLQQTEGKILSQTKLNEHDFYTQTVSWWCQAELSNLILISTETLMCDSH